MFTVRRAAPSDAYAIASIHVSTWREAYNGLLSQRYLDSMDPRRLRDYWRGEISRSARPTDEAVLLAQLPGGGVLAFASAGVAQRPGAPGQAEIYTLYVTRSVRGRGVGRALLKACAKHCLSRGLFSANVWVLKDNVRGRRVYEVLGARLVAEAEDQVGGGAAALVGYVWDDLADLAGCTASVRR